MRQPPLRTGDQYAQRLSEALDQHAAVAVTDGRGRVLSLNERFARLTGAAAGRDLAWIGPSQWQNLRAGQSWQGQLPLPARQPPLTLDCTLVPFLDVGGKLEQVYILCQASAPGREAAEELSQMRKQYRSAFHSSAIGIAVSDLSGAISSINPAACQLFSYDDASALQGRSMIHLIAESHRQQAEGQLADLPAGEQTAFSMEVQCVAADGVPFWVQLSATCVADGHPPHIIWHFQDLRRSKTLQQHLRNEQAFTDAVIDSLPGLFYVIGEDGRFIRWNTRLESTSGYSDAEVLAMGPMGLLAEDDRAAAQRALNDCFIHGEATTEGRLRGKDGSYIPFVFTGIRAEVQGQTCVVGVGLDLSERKHAEQELLRFRAALESSADGIYLIDPRTMQFIDANRTGWEGLGYERSELHRMGPQDLKPRYGIETLRREFEHVLHSDSLAGVIETIHRRRDGSEFPVEVYVRAHWNQGEPLIAAVARDVTRRKHIENELVRAKEEAEAASRAKTEFLSRMSHELRTPLNAILGFAQLLSHDGEPASEAEQREAVEQIQSAGWHLLALINEVLDLTKIESGHMHIHLDAVSVAEVLKESESMVAADAKARKLRLDMQDVDASWQVVADRVRLRQVLLNLLSNAVKYNRRRGRIQVTVNAADGRTRLAVSDTGIGIAPENMRRLFAPFDRLDQDDNAVSGAGIGLVIAKHLTELMGGEFGVTSQVGRGSTFWLELPTVESDGNTAGYLPHSGRYQVLCVEDNPANLRLLQAILASQDDLQLLTTSTATGALSISRTHALDLVLLDISLPDADGFTVLSQLRADPWTAKVPVVAISANAAPEDIEKGLAAGFEAYLAKPIDVTELKRTLDEILRRQRR